ncbi:MAG: Gfo/Idh/MocA family oxidoreductase [Victivallales bacterium]|jgi:predicted dehydrogenase|nr:Gfo/Idh/MocA family oxidoreductase [Victivallales bacterium]MBT7302089.1 Gfo/Idh/MocA family oxidoreductase [Victivallales bacterium]
MQPVKVGVIGTGSLGFRHVQGYQAATGVELVGIYDINPETQSRICAECGVHGFANADEVIEAAEAVSVVVPSDQHYEVARPVLEAGRHLLVEKPLTNNLPQAEELVALAAERDLLMAVGHLEEFNPVLPLLDQAPGPPRFIRAERFAPYPPQRRPLRPRGCEVSVVLDLMIHDLDVVLTLVGGDIVEIEATGQTLISESEDIAWARLVFANGCIAEVAASRVNPAPSRQLFVAKDSAHFALGYATQEGTLTRWDADGTQTVQLTPERRNPLFDELQDFADCVAARRAGQSRTPRVPGAAGLRALRLAMRVQDAIRS